MEEKKTGVGRWFPVVAIGCLLAVTLLAGCAGRGDKEAANEAPEAQLDSNKDRAFTGEQFTFDAGKSDDPDGMIEEYRFDFGDGFSEVRSRSDDPKVSHAYLRGGEFTVTLTVTDNGGPDAGKLTDSDSLSIAVNERRAITPQTIFAAPANQTAGKYSQPFDVYRGGDRFELDVTLRSAVPVGSSEVTVRVLDPTGDMLDEEKKTIAAGSTETVNLDGDIDEQGSHKIEIIAHSGGVAIEGQLRVYYDENF